MINEARCSEFSKAAFDKELRMTEQDEGNFMTIDRCDICWRCYESDSIRVRDHCHIAGQYRGLDYRDCNLNYRILKRIPVVFHNLRGYDRHLLMQSTS